MTNATTAEEFRFDQKYLVREIIGNWHIWAIGIGADLKPLLLVAETPRRVSQNPSTSGSTRVRIVDLSGVILCELRADPKFSHVQSLPDRSWLVAAHWPDDNAINGWVYDQNGNQIDALSLGGGIKDVQVSTVGHIWVSYFDEGIYGAGGSGEGLIGFNRDGSVRFRFSQLFEQGLPPIDDCYALNVVDDLVCLYYYSAFPLVKLRQGRVLEWRKSVPVHGAGAFAIAGEQVIFIGSYQEHNGLYRLGPSTAPVLMRPVDSDREHIEVKRAYARGNKLVLLTEAAVFTASV